MLAVDKKKQERHFSVVYSSLISGAMTGACAKTTIAPFCRMRMTYQVTPNSLFSFKAGYASMKQSYQSAGISSFFRGNSLQVARCMPFAAIQWTAFEQCKLALHTDEPGNSSLARNMVCGVAGGQTATCLTYPLDVANARMATNLRYKGIKDVFVDCYRTSGIKTFYRGITPTLLGAIPYSGTYFGVCETLKSRYQQRVGRKASPFIVFIFGAFSGLLGQTMAYPLDTVRRRMQTGKVPMQQSITSTIFEIVRNEGLQKGLYRGLSVNWSIQPISAGIYFAFYDVIHSNVNRLMQLTE